MMAFNPYGNYFNNANNNYPNQMQPQIQNGGFVMVRSEMEARNYPVAFGNSVTFKDETAPYIYSKTMGFSQLDRPIFEKYKLVKEEAKEPVVESTSLESLRSEMERLWAEVNLLKENRNEQSVKRNSAAKSNKTEPDEDSVDAV